LKPLIRTSRNVPLIPDLVVGNLLLGRQISTEPLAIGRAFRDGVEPELASSERSRSSGQGKAGTSPDEAVALVGIG
jgi:hypothetical protein